jgi:hypothetical protein
MTKHILTIELKGNNTYHDMSHSWVYEESVTLYFGLFEKLAPNTLFKDNISFELESLYFHYLYADTKNCLSITTPVWRATILNIC